jgi:uncharacterized membrane protein
MNSVNTLRLIAFIPFAFYAYTSYKMGLHNMIMWYYAVMLTCSFSLLLFMFLLSRNKTILAKDLDEKSKQLEEFIRKEMGADFIVKRSGDGLEISPQKKKSTGT